ncbi:transposase family protein [Rhodococcus pyridinivorans]|nr:transposase family protein [Rhodococcus pyridinivorans]
MVESGSIHDITEAGIHCLSALYKAADGGVPPLVDKGYEGAASSYTPRSRTAASTSRNRRYNLLPTTLRAIGERADAELKQRWNSRRRIRLFPSRIGQIVAAAIVLSTLQRGNY